ncbi:tRNA methyltransferase complex subunit Cpd1 [Auriscalpium vulgare]|uniref:tRNA methyltransferase complex subunit Cpd1 n=1 Tax=Auriscalpium vulgare TaxID=40419 RepID=A0ACB8RET5_9AGAM|nr:tRNA methyltransferase complex subunit Cpd1 [Auriscalpium vulgare]
MWSTSTHIAVGDLLVVWLTRDMIQSLVVTPGADFNSRFGNYRHADFVGLPYGSKVRPRTGTGFIHLLRPTPELWTLALPHRTQILYLADIAFITSWLDIRPGAIVVEAGTGSGSFTHSVARTVGSAGKVHSYEFHEARASKARYKFSRRGMANIVSLTHRNVCMDGFTVAGTAGAVFLDLPAPWEAVEHAKTALRNDRAGRICCFSPCIEQVLRTVSALNESGFTDITMYETLLRPHEVNQVPALPSVSSISAKLKDAARVREEKRLIQIATARTRHAEKRKREEDADELEPKKVKTDADAGARAEDVEMPGAAVRETAAEAGAAAGEADPGDAPPAMQIVSKVVQEVRGHTSYLTFARLLPSAHAAPSQ